MANEVQELFELSLKLKDKKAAIASKRAALKGRGEEIKKIARLLIEKPECLKMQDGGSGPSLLSQSCEEDPDHIDMRTGAAIDLFSVQKINEELIALRYSLEEFAEIESRIAHLEATRPKDQD